LILKIAWIRFGCKLFHSVKLDRFRILLPFSANQAINTKRGFCFKEIMERQKKLTPLTVFVAQPTFNAFLMNVIPQNTQMSSGKEFGLRWQTKCDTAFPSAQ
jgi:hypothetical protein